MDADVRRYLAKIGSRGGRASRRTLTSEDARRMVRLREARRAYRAFHGKCFWSFDPDYVVSARDIDWVGRRLMEFGGREGWVRGAKLCR